MADSAAHPRTRYRERYGSELSAAELRALEGRLAAGEGMTLRRQADGVDIRVLRLVDDLVTVAFDVAAGRVKTFLPRDASALGRFWRARRRRAADGG